MPLFDRNWFQGAGCADLSSECSKMSLKPHVLRLVLLVHVVESKGRWFVKVKAFFFLNICSRMHRAQLSITCINHFASLRCLTFNILSILLVCSFSYPPEFLWVTMILIEIVAGETFIFTKNKWFFENNEIKLHFFLLVTLLCNNLSLANFRCDLTLIIEHFTREFCSRNNVCCTELFQSFISSGGLKRNSKQVYWGTGKLLKFLSTSSTARAGSEVWLLLIFTSYSYNKLKTSIKKKNCR